MIRNITAAMALALASTSAIAATCTWTGNGADTKWSTPANWNTCGGIRDVPLNTDTLIFPDNVPTASKTNTNDLVGLQPWALQLNGLNYDISGNAITLTTGITVNTPVGGFSDLGPRFRPDITLASGQTFTCTAGKFLYLDGALNLNAHPLAIDGACNTALRGAVSGSGELKKFGTGSLYMQFGPYTYSGATTINAGTIYAGNASGLGTTGSGNATSVNSGATLSLYLGVTVGETVNLYGGTLENFLGDNTVTGEVNLFTASTVDVASGTTLKLTGPVAGAPLTKVGAGTLVITNTGVVDLILDEGTVEVDGLVDGATIAAGATLSGTGNLVGTIQVLGSGTLAPGTRTSPGVLSATSLLWYADSAIRMRLGPKSDRIVLSNSLTRLGGGTYEFQFRDGSKPPVVGVEYTLVEYAGESGFDANTFAYSYQGTGAFTSLTGAFSVSQTKITFTPLSVVSDLIFRDGAEP